MLRRDKKGGGAPAWPPSQTAGAVPESPFSSAVVPSTADQPGLSPGVLRTNLGIVNATVRSADGNPKVDQALDNLAMAALKRGATHVYGLRVELASTTMGQMNTCVYGTAYRVTESGEQDGVRVREVPTD